MANTIGNAPKTDSATIAARRDELRTSEVKGAKALATAHDKGLISDEQFLERSDDLFNSRDGYLKIVGNNDSAAFSRGINRFTSPVAAPSASSVSYDQRAVAFMGEIARTDLSGRNRGGDVTTMETIISP